MRRAINNVSAERGGETVRLKRWAKCRDERHAALARARPNDEKRGVMPDDQHGYDRSKVCEPAQVIQQHDRQYTDKNPERVFHSIEGFRRNESEKHHHLRPNETKMSCGD
jgi:hypothetical protein